MKIVTLGLTAALTLTSGLCAEEIAKMEQLAQPALTLSEMYAKAEAKAKAWKPDVVPVRLGNTSMGPLDAQGRSTAWNLTFYSPSAKANVAVNLFRGMVTYWASPGDAGRIPDLKPGFLRDSAKLYAIAKQHGADLIAKGYAVSIQTAAAPSDRHATWYLTFATSDGTTADLTVIVDANTGAVEKVLRD